MKILPEWMYHAIEESFTCQFTSFTARGVPVALPIFLSHFDPDTGTLIFSSALLARRIENVRHNPHVAVLFSPAGKDEAEPAHVVLVQGEAEVDDADPEHGWERYFAGWARRQPSARQTLQMRDTMPGYFQRAIIRVRPTRILGWQNGDLNQQPELLEVNE